MSPKSKRPDPAALAALAAGSTINPAPAPDPVLPTTNTTPDKKIFSVRISTAVAGRLRAAWAAELAHGTHNEPFSQWVEHLLSTAAADTENRLNNGHPFPPIPPGVIPTGRPHQRGQEPQERKTK